MIYAEQLSKKLIPIPKTYFINSLRVSSVCIGLGTVSTIQDRVYFLKEVNGNGIRHKLIFYFIGLSQKFKKDVKFKHENNKTDVLPVFAGKPNQLHLHEPGRACRGIGSQ
jgi:hypothetical protein